MPKPYDYGIWPLVIVNIIIFTFFVLSYLKPKKRIEWQSLGTFTAFLVALFTEMYGFPLTIYLLTSALGSRYPVLQPFTHINGNLLVVFLGGSSLVSGVIMTLTGLIVLAGLIMMGTAWNQIHKSQGNLITTGLYGRIRHPQYSALFLIILGFLIQWPTLITLAMAPILIFTYYRLARKEEKELELKFGEEYLLYRRRVPMFFPEFIPSRGIRVSKDTLS